MKRYSFVLVLFFLLFGGCPGFGEVASDLGSAALNCAKSSMQSKVGAIVGEVLKLARAGGDGWKDSVLGLGTSVGVDALQCAIKAALGELSSTRAIGDKAAVERLQALQADKGWK